MREAAASANSKSFLIRLRRGAHSEISAFVSFTSSSVCSQLRHSRINGVVGDGGGRDSRIYYNSSETFLPVKLPPHEGTGILSKTTGLYSVVVVVVVVVCCEYSSMRSCSAKSLGNRWTPPIVSSAGACRTHKKQTIIIAWQDHHSTYSEAIKYKIRRQQAATNTSRSCCVTHTIHDRRTKNKKNYKKKTHTHTHSLSSYC